MDQTMTMLADGAEDLLGYLPLFVIAGLIFMGNLIRRKMEEREAQTQRKKAVEDRSKSSSPPARPANKQTLPGSLREVIAGATTAPKSSPPEPKPAPPPAEPAPRKRRRRRPEPEPASAVEAAPASEPAPRKVTPAMARRVKQAPKTQVDLSSRDKLRQAIIYHEIFGLPKSLRSGDESWDKV